MGKVAKSKYAIPGAKLSTSVRRAEKGSVFVCQSEATANSLRKECERQNRKDLRVIVRPGKPH